MGRRRYATGDSILKIVKPIVFNSFSGFTRDSVATYYNSEGYVTEVGADVLRLTYNPTTLNFIGPLIEQEATNLIEYSENFSENEPDKWGVSTGLIVLPVAEFNPSGEIGAYRLDIDSPGRGISYALVLGTGVIFAFSIYVKLVSGSRYIILGGNSGERYFDIHPSAAGVSYPDGSFSQKLQNGWFRLCIVGPSDPVYPAIVGYNAATRVLLWGAQAELGDAATSYIATDGGTATRAADVAVIAPPRVVETNVEEDDAPVWTSGGSYSAADTVMVLDQYHRVYESIGATPAGMYPPDHPEYWIDRGATNRWRMFDMNVGADKQTVSTNSSNTIEVLLDLDQIVNSVSLLNLEASTVTVIMRDSEGNEIYNRFVNLLQMVAASDWWSFFFAPRKYIRTVVLTDLPIEIPSTIEVIIDGDSEPAKVGKLIVGEAVDIGCARYGTSVGIVDFSRKERDPFGNNFIVERRYIDRADFDVQIPTANVDDVKYLLASIRATPSLYIGDEDFNSTVLYGFYKDFSIVISGPRKSDATIQVEGI